MSDVGVMTPYSTVMPLVTQEEQWVPEEERDRIASYTVYDSMYWSVPHAFKLTQRGTNEQPIYIPNARTVVNETAHYLLKGLSVVPDGDPEMKSEFGLVLKDWLKREEFYAKFHTAKWSGVTRGDWVLHITADPDKPEGRRVSINSVDPASYFPIYDPDDIDRVIGVDLVEIFKDVADGKYYVKKLRYMKVEGIPRVSRQEVVLEVDGWWKGKAAKVKQVLLKEELLEDGIENIPVYHFKNIDWQGQPFGSSELRGFEFLLGSINQTVSDEELALALEGLGTYATDAPKPTKADGSSGEWEIAPAIVNEVPTGSFFKRIEGIKSVTPMQDHLKFLTDSLFEGSATFRTTNIDVTLAESGVAMAIRFLPTLAKLEQRDWTGIAKLEHLFFDLKFWIKAYEQGSDFTETDVLVTLGDKLPLNRTERVNELNNMLDRMVISRKYYRQEMTKLGYTFPDNMEDEVLTEQEKLTEARMFESPENGDNPAGNQSNNKGRTNESNGTESTRKPAAQTQ